MTFMKGISMDQVFPDACFNTIQSVFDAENSTSLYTHTESNLADRVLGQSRKSSFIALPGKGAIELMPS